MKERVDRKHLYATLRYGSKHDMRAHTEDTDEISYIPLNHAYTEMIADLVDAEYERKDSFSSELETRRLCDEGKGAAEKARERIRNNETKKT